jgi:hypothetical protein
MDASHEHLTVGCPIADRRWQCHAAPCGPRRGLSMASASGHAMPQRSGRHHAQLGRRVVTGEPP